MALLLRLSLIFTLIWCGLHIAEPAQAHGPSHLAEATHAAPSQPDGDPDREDRSESAHMGHHHCPVAPDQRIGAGRGCRLPVTSLTFQQPVDRLRSLSQAPPLQPPAT